MADPAVTDRTARGRLPGRPLSIKETEEKETKANERNKKKKTGE